MSRQNPTNWFLLLWKNGLLVHSARTAVGTTASLTVARLLGEAKTRKTPKHCYDFLPPLFFCVIQGKTCELPLLIGMTLMPRNVLPGHRTTIKYLNLRIFD